MQEMHNDDTEYQKYLAHMKRTRNRKDRLGNPIEFRLTFTEWKRIWDESGHAHERGRGKGKYCMARFDDLGHYEVGNIKIQSFTDNFLEAARRGHPSKDKGKRRGPLPDATCQKISAARTGVKRGPYGRRGPLTEKHKQ